MGPEFITLIIKPRIVSKEGHSWLALGLGIIDAALHLNQLKKNGATENPPNNVHSKAERNCWTKILIPSTMLRVFFEETIAQEISIVCNVYFWKEQ